jgi:hypothetical protein
LLLAEQLELLLAEQLELQLSLWRHQFNSCWPVSTGAAVTRGAVVPPGPMHPSLGKSDVLVRVQKKLKNTKISSFKGSPRDQHWNQNYGSIECVTLEWKISMENIIFFFFKKTSGKYYTGRIQVPILHQKLRQSNQCCASKSGSGQIQTFWLGCMDPQ